MKKNTKHLILFMAFMVIVGIASAVNITTQLNGDFETGDLTGWVTYAGSTGVVTDGSYAMEIAPAYPTDPNWMVVHNAWYYAPTEGDTVSFEFDIKLAAGTNQTNDVQVYARFLASDYTVLDQILIMSGDQDGNWNHLTSAPMTVPVGTFTTDILIYGNTSSSSADIGVYRFDNFVLDLDTTLPFDGSFEKQAYAQPGWVYANPLGTPAQNPGITTEDASEGVSSLKCVLTADSGAGDGGGAAAQNVGYQLAVTDSLYTVTPGQKYTLTWDAKKLAGFVDGGDVVIQVRFLDAAYAPLQDAPYNLPYGVSFINVPTVPAAENTWESFSGEIVAPVEAAFWDIVVWAGYLGGETTSDGTLYLDNFVMTETERDPSIEVLGYWDFEEGAPVSGGGTTTDKSTVLPAIDLELGADAEIIYDSDRGNYVLDPRPGFTKREDNPPSDDGGASSPEPSSTDPNLAKMSGDDAFTFSVWVKPRDIADANEAILDEGYEEQWGQIAGDSEGACRILSMNSGLLADCLWPEDLGYPSVWRGTDWWPLSPTWDGTGPWHHLLVTSDGYKLELYVDGVKHNTTDIPNLIAQGYDAALFSATTSWVIGGDTTHMIDDVGFVRGYCPEWAVQTLYEGTTDLFDVYLESWVEVPPIQPDPPVCKFSGYAGEDNLVAWYHFEEGPGATTTADLTSSFTPADGTLENGSDIVYDSTSDYLVDLDYTVGNAFLGEDPNTYDNAGGHTDGTWVNMGTDDKFTYQQLDMGFTMSAWINPDDLHEEEDEPDSDPDHYHNWGTILNKGNPNSRPDLSWPEPGAGSGSYLMRMYKGRLEFTLNFENDQVSGGPTTFGADGLEPGLWNHVAVVYDPCHPEGYDPDDEQTYGNFRTASDEIRLYINGELQTLSVNPATTVWKGRIRHDMDSASSYPLHIGDAWRPFRGMIDDVRIYDAALNDDEIKCLVYRCTGATGDDCFADLLDFADLAEGWQSPYALDDLKELAAAWLDDNLIYPVY